MDINIDGNYTLAETQNTVRFIEATGYKLVSLVADGGTVNNVAGFEETDDIIRTSLLELAAGRNCGSKGPPPAGSWVCCSDQVYVSGTKKPVGAYR
jgi:hypothetical protein